jgi:hypothetical protein
MAHGTTTHTNRSTKSLTTENKIRQPTNTPPHQTQKRSQPPTKRRIQPPHRPTSSHPTPHSSHKRQKLFLEQLLLDRVLTRTQYTMACQRASTGKAPGPDALPNEVLKYLPENAHDVIFTLFTIMARYSYTPKKWCTSATILIYKPNKKDPRNLAKYRPIALMNYILKIWTSILTIIGTQTAESVRIFSDTADGFRSHHIIYDNISTHITMYEDAKLSKKNIYTAYSDFKGAFGGLDHRILFQIMKEYGFQDSYITTCKQLYVTSNTYYMTIHGNTLPIPIDRGTL